LLGFDWNLIEGFLLAFVRISAALVIMPVFGYTAIPVQAKAGIGFLLAIPLAPVAAISLPYTIYGPLPFFGAVAGEALIGFVIGAASLLMLIGSEFAGTLIGLQMGFSIVNVMDPQQEQEISIIGRIEYLLALMVFLALDMHHLLLGALGESFVRIPLGVGFFGAEVPILFGRMTADVFIIAVKLAAPVLAILLMVEIALGFIARAMPQMNVFADSFPLKIGVGMAAMVVTWPLFVYVLSRSFDKFGGDLFRIVRSMGPP